MNENICKSPQGIVLALDYMNEQELVAILRFLNTYQLDFDLASPYKKAGKQVLIEKEALDPQIVLSTPNQITTSISFAHVRSKKYDFGIVVGGRHEKYMTKCSMMSCIMRMFLLAEKPISSVLAESLTLTEDGIRLHERDAKEPAYGPEILLAVGDLVGRQLTRDLVAPLDGCSWFTNNAWKTWVKSISNYQNK